MSIVIKRASCVEITLLKSIFATSISAVGVATAPGKLILSPPTVSSEQCSIGFGLFWSYRAHELPICDVFHLFCWYFVLEYKLDSVGGIFYSAANAIC